MLLGVLSNKHMGHSKHFLTVMSPTDLDLIEIDTVLTPYTD